MVVGSGHLSEIISQSILYKPQIPLITQQDLLKIGVAIHLSETGAISG